MKKIKKLIFSLLIIILCIPAPARASDIAFGHEGIILPAGEHEFKALEISREIYQAMLTGGDIRIYDKNGEQTPYFVYVNEVRQWEKTLTGGSGKVVNSFVKNNDYYVDFKLDEPSGMTDTLTKSLELELSENVTFAKRVNVYGSYDGVHWDYVTQCTLYNVEGSRSLTVTFQQVLKYTYYRLELFNNLEKVNFTGVHSVSENIKSERFVKTEEFTPEYKISKDGAYTHIDISGLRHMKIESVELLTDGLFRRRISGSYITPKLIQNIDYGDITITDTVIPINRHMGRQDGMTLTILDNDDKPVDISDIKVSYIKEYLFFRAPGNEPLTVRVGNTDTAYGVYDVAVYEDYVLRTGYDTVEISGFKSTGGDIPGKKDDGQERLIFNAAIAVMALVLAVVVLTNIKKVNKT